MHILRIKKNENQFSQTQKYRFTNHRHNRLSFVLVRNAKCRFTPHEKV